MDLTIYDIILGPVYSNKAGELNKIHHKLVLLVHPQANKPMIKSAVEMLFKVEIKSVNTINRSGKIRRVGRRVIRGKSRKIAIITLAKGYKLDLFGQIGAQSVAAAESVNETV